MNRIDESNVTAADKPEMEDEGVKRSIAVAAAIVAVHEEHDVVAGTGGAEMSDVVVVGGRGNEEKGVANIAVEVNNIEEPGAVNYVVESRPDVLARREGQLQHVYATREYKKYLEAVPKQERDPNNPNHPTTPNKNRFYTRRSWDALCNTWKNNVRNSWRDPCLFFSYSWADEVEEYYFGDDGPEDDFDYINSK